MIKTLKHLLEQLLRKKRFIMNKATDQELVVQLIESLHPIETQIELIRLGPNGDGGYLVPDDFEGIEACFSPGVDLISEFELDCLKYGMKLFMADKSVDKPNLNVSEDQYDFLKKFVGCTNDNDFITMDEWVKSSGFANNSELILQMDIEGAEYHSIINMTDALMKQFRIMVIEFHYLDRFWNPDFFDTAKTVFDKILKTHECLHIHPNNCSRIDSQFGVDIPITVEFTFIRKDRVKTKKYKSGFPHQLDFDNTKEEHIVLPKNWYKS